MPMKRGRSKRSAAIVWITEPNVSARKTVIQVSSDLKLRGVGADVFSGSPLSHASLKRSALLSHRESRTLR